MTLPLSNYFSGKRQFCRIMLPKKCTLSYEKYHEQKAKVLIHEVFLKEWRKARESSKDFLF